MDNIQIEQKITELQAESDRLYKWQKELEHKSYGLKLREETDNKWVIDRELWYQRGCQDKNSGIRIVIIVVLCIPLFFAALILAITAKNIITFDAAVEDILEKDNGIVAYNDETGTEYVLQLTSSNSNYDFCIVSMRDKRDRQYYEILSSRQIEYKNIDRNASIGFISGGTDINKTYINEKYVISDKDGTKYYGFDIKEAREIKRELYRDNE